MTVREYLRSRKGDANDPAPSSRDVSVGVKPKDEIFPVSPQPGLAATTTHRIIESAQWAKREERMKTRDWAKEWMGMVNDGSLKVGAHPLLIPNAKGRSQSLGVRSNDMECGLNDLLIHV